MSCRFWSVCSALPVVGAPPFPRKESLGGESIALFGGMGKYMETQIFR